jgi:transposase
MVLCYSRMLYVEFTVSQSMEHFLACHQNGFNFFGAIPAKIMVDNLKSAVLKRIIGRAPVFNPKYLDFANHYGFTIAPCNSLAAIRVLRQPIKKGWKVAKLVPCSRSSFLDLRNMA